jgi:hypothetical protein
MIIKSIDLPAKIGKSLIIVPITPEEIMEGMEDMEINMIIKITDLPAKIGKGHLIVIVPKAPEGIMKEGSIPITKIGEGTEITREKEGILMIGVVPQPRKCIFASQK